MQFTHILLLIFIFFLIFYLNKKFKKYKSIYCSNGLDGVLYYFLNKNFASTGFNSFIDKKKYLLGKKIATLTKQKVLFGPYSGTKFIDLHGWSKIDSAPKYLGTYERQIQDEIVFLSKKFKLKYFVDLGAAEGYHLISLLKKKIFKRGLAYEIDEKSRTILKKNSKINNVYNKIKIFEKADFISLKKNLIYKELKKTCFLVDIEGNEYNLFTNEFCKYFSRSIFIVEDHDFNIKNKQLKNKFYKTVKKYFKINIINDISKNPFDIDILENFSDDEKYLMLSEGRPKSMKWILLYPKKNN
tara:strand:+ start:2643 stop:3539 length:897 start_codon:yes stop_codon:yes gene_type:complete